MELLSTLPETAEITTILVDSVVYERKRGELVFRVSKEQPEKGMSLDENLTISRRKQPFDIVEARRLRNMLFEGVLDLSDTTHLQLIHNAGIKTIQTSTPGSYTAIMHYRVYEQVVARYRIPYRHLRALVDTSESYPRAVPDSKKK